MVKYKNFGDRQSIGSFSFASQNSAHSTKTNRTVKTSSRSQRRRDERSPSITRQPEDEYRDEDVDGSRFDPRVLTLGSTEEEEMKEEEAESLYDMISYNGVTDEHSTSVCASSYSYSASAGETDDSLSDTREQPQQSPRRAKLSYMGYVPVSPNTAAAMALMEAKEGSESANHTARHRNSINKDHSNSNHTGAEESKSTIPSIKVDDTSTSRRRLRNYSESDSEQQQSSVMTDEITGANISEYISPAQRRQPKKTLYVNTKDNATVTSSSVADRTLPSRFEDATIETSVVSSVMPNPCTGHPAMKPRQQELQGTQQYRNQNNFNPLPPTAPTPTSSTGKTNGHGTDAASTAGSQYNWGMLSPLSAGVSAINGMIPPSLNHAPPPIMHQGPYQQQHYGAYPQQPMPVHPNQHHMPQLYQYGPGGNHPQFSPHQQSHPQQFQQQQPRPFQSGFFPRNPVLARQLQAFHQYHHNHNNQQKEPERKASQPSSTLSLEEPPQSPRIEEPPHIKRAFEPVIPKRKNSEKSDKSNNSDHQPFLICGPEGPRLLESVKFVTPDPSKRKYASGSFSSHSRYSVGGALDVGCVQNPAGIKCQSAIASFLNTCGAIVNHGYHIDNSKASSKEKKAKFGKVADKSIAGMGRQQSSSSSSQEEHASHQRHGNDEGIHGIGSGLNDAFAENAKKIFDAGNTMISTLPRDLQNLTPSAAYHNVLQTFGASPILSTEDPSARGIRAALSDDPDEVKEANKPKEETPRSPISPTNAQRYHFKNLRRRRKRDSPIRRSASEPDPALSPKSASSAEKNLQASFENFKNRYSRNIHTKMASEKLEKADARDPEPSNAEPPVCKEPDGNKDPAGKNLSGIRDEDSHCSWATPPQDEKEKSSTHTADSLEEVLGERAGLSTTSSGMSESLVGSDMGEESDEEPHLVDSFLNSSNSEDDNQELIARTNDDDKDEHLILDSYEHNEFPHTPLDVIEEGSEDENDASIASKRNEQQVLDTTPSDELSLDENGCLDGRRTSIGSMISIIRTVFVTMLLFQCGSMVCLWDQIADQIRTMEGGHEVVAAAEDVVANLKASGVSLVTTAQDILADVETSVDLTVVGDILSEIELRTTALVGSANQFLADFSAGSSGLSEVEQQQAEDLQLFHQLVDDALSSEDDDVVKGAFNDISYTKTEDDRLDENIDWETYPVNTFDDTSTVYEDAVEQLSTE